MDTQRTARNTQAKSPWSLRPVEPQDLAFLRKMLWEAAYWRDASTRTPVAGDLETPDLAYLLATWGRAGDVGVLAETKGRRALGAAWYRLWTEEQHSYGFVSPAIPELAVAVAAEARGLGVGTALVTELLRVAEESGVSGVSLSVEPENPARRLYKRLKFRKVDAVGGGWTMLYRCRSRGSPTNAPSRRHSATYRARAHR